MSGIACVIDSSVSIAQNEERLHTLLSQIRHRGDEEHFYEAKILPSSALGCNRLAIVDREYGQQPVTNSAETIFAVLDGQIYNYKELRQELSLLGYQFRTQSDTEVLVYGYQAWKDQLVDHLDGAFAFIIYDCVDNSFMAARDHMGIKPLYYLHNGAYFIASEMKALLSFGQDICVLLPGYLLTPAGLHAYYQIPAMTIEDTDDMAVMAPFKDIFKAAIKKQVQTDLPIGVMFSGGLDSAAVLCLAAQYHPNITAFTVGFEGAADVEVARRYCLDLGIRQHIIHLNMEELIQDLPLAIYYGETFEPTNVMDVCITAPAYKLAKELGIKIMLCGDGSDELLAGYDFFRTYPDPNYVMTYRLSNWYRTDAQRIDRTSMRYTIDTRLPFMDRDFLNFTYNIPMTMKIRNDVEKWILREVLGNDLPDYIVHRPKIRLSDGSGLKWQLQDFASQQRVEIDPATFSHLHIDQVSGIYFLEQYLKLGYAMPFERYKKPGLDFSPNGYFDFIS